MIPTKEEIDRANAAANPDPGSQRQAANQDDAGPSTRGDVEASLETETVFVYCLALLLLMPFRLIPALTPPVIRVLSASLPQNAVLLSLE